MAGGGPRVRGRQFGHARARRYRRRFRYRFAEDRPDVDVLLSYRPDDSVVERWLQPRTVFNVYLRGIDGRPAGFAGRPDPAGARVTMPSVAGDGAVLAEHPPHSRRPGGGRGQILKALTRPIGRPAEAVTLERTIGRRELDPAGGCSWRKCARRYGRTPGGCCESPRRSPTSPPLCHARWEQIEKRLHRPPACCC